MDLADWKEIEKIALIGTDHLPISEALLRKLQQLGIAVGENTDVQTLLEALAYYAQLQKTSMPIQTTSVASLTPPFSFPKVHYLPFPLVALLFRILRKHPSALQEFIDLAQKKNRFIPPEYVPQLLPFLEHKHAYPQWHLVRLLLDQQGLWLLQQHSNWHHFLKRKGEAKLWNPKEVVVATKELLRFQAELNERLSYLENLHWQRIKDWTYQADLKQYDQLRRNWEPTATQSSMWSNRLFQLFGILDFRKKMHALFEINQ